MADILKWDSNNATVADREIATCRVRSGALEICTDEKTGRFVGVHLDKGAPPAPDPYDFSYIPPAELEFKMALGQIDAVVNRLIPFPYPLTLANGEESPRMYDMVVGGVTYTFDEATRDSFPFTSGIFSLEIGFWGFIPPPVYDDADAGSLPANGVSQTLLTITSFRVSNLAGTIISPPFTNGGAGYAVKIVGTGASADVTAPTVSGVTPAGIDVVLDQVITITCSETVRAGSGNFVIWDTIADSALETIAAASASYEGNRIVLTRANSETHSNSYEIRWDAGTFEDLAGNPVAAETGGTYQWVTEASGGGGTPPPPAVAPDVVVSSIAALVSLMASWAGTSNWNSTAAGLGLTAGDPRTIGYDAALTGTINLSGMVFPQLVTIRPVASFANNFSNSCPVTGAINMANSSNIRWYLSELRAPAGANAQGWVTINGASYIYFDRVVARGEPYVYAAGNHATTSRFIHVTASTDHIYFKDFVHRYMKDVTINWNGGVHTNWDIDGFGGEYHCGDDMGDIGFGGTINGFNVRGYLGDRTRSKFVGKHCDGIQSFQAPAKITNVHWSYCIGLKGDWIDTGETKGVGWQYIYQSSGGGDPTGVSTADQCLFSNGHARGTDKPAANSYAVTNCTFLFGPYQPFTYGNAPFPSPFGCRASNGASYSNGWSISNCYQVVNGLGRANVILQTNGNIVRVVPGSNAATWNFSSVTPDVMNLPVETNSLWDVRPKAGGALDPNGTACGCYDLWNKLYAMDPIVCKSVVGWPMREFFIKHFDPNSNFTGGTILLNDPYDGDGNNA